MNVKIVINGDLCCGCGACVGVCPNGAISIDIRESYIPVLSDEKCTLCGLCYAVCPGKGYPVREMAELQKSADQVQIHSEYGPVTGYYRAQAIDPVVKSAGASGGAATSLLLYMLEAGLVECVVVPVLKDGFVEPVITDDPMIILSAQGSKYVPVPMAQIIANIQKRPRRFAMTCTPCQLAAWKMAEQKISTLRNCLVLSIGLFCGYVQRYDGIRSLARIMGVDYPKNAKFLGWRCGSYPGSTCFILENGSAVEKPYYTSANILIPFFSLNRCLLCPEGANWLADLVLGDVHSEQEDETVVLCRSRKGLHILTQAFTANRIKLCKEDDSFARRTTINTIISAKMYPVLTVIETLVKKKKLVPIFDFVKIPYATKNCNYMKKYWILRYYLISSFKQKKVSEFLERFPRLFERIGYLLYGFPKTIPGWHHKEELVRRIRQYCKWRED